VKKEPKEWELAVVELKLAGYTYEEIRKMIEEEYGEKKALSSLRGTKRNIVTPKDLRPRSPKWEAMHVSSPSFSLRFLLLSPSFLPLNGRPESSRFNPRHVYSLIIFLLRLPFPLHPSDHSPPSSSFTTPHTPTFTTPHHLPLIMPHSASQPN